MGRAVVPPLAVRVPHRKRKVSSFRPWSPIRNSGATLRRDRVQYELPFGILGSAVQKVMVARELELVSDCRAWTLEEMSVWAAKTA